MLNCGTCLRFPRCAPEWETAPGPVHSCSLPTAPPSIRCFALNPWRSRTGCSDCSSDGLRIKLELSNSSQQTLRLHQLLKQTSAEKRTKSLRTCFEPEPALPGSSWDTSQGVRGVEQAVSTPSSCRRSKNSSLALSRGPCCLWEQEVPAGVGAGQALQWHQDHVSHRHLYFHTSAWMNVLFPGMQW